jgi:hypothetical protein
VEAGDFVIPTMPREGHPIWGLIRIALLTVRVICRLMEPVTLLHMQLILMVLMVLAEDLAAVEDLAGAEDSAGEDGGKPDKKPPVNLVILIIIY